MTFLIDGYNLMHASGFASPRMAAKRFEHARKKLLDWLADELGGRPAVIRVVFDAQRAVGPSPEQTYRGVRYRFAYRETADDLIERLVAAEPRPADVSVVSNDARVVEAGRRRGCAGRSCEEFTDWLIARRAVPGPAGPPAPEKPDGPLPPDEREELLRAFSAPAAKRRR